MAGYQASHRFITLLQAGKVPDEIRRDAAAGRLSLPFGDRLVILVHLAENDPEWAETATATLGHLHAYAVAEVLADPTCPDAVLAWFNRAAATGADDAPFSLTDASGEEQEALRAPSAPQSSEGLLVRLARMSPPQRVQAALRGSRDERMILIRDTNRVVWRAVLDSPRLSENDVELIAAMRNIHEDALRYIAGQRRFLRSLVVVRNLVNNPRTPLDIALPLLKHLFAVDLQFVARNRMVNEQIRRQAAKLLQQKQSS
jgi:hypothetical protein